MRRSRRRHLPNGGSSFEPLGVGEPYSPVAQGDPGAGFFDTDPAFTQILHLTDPDARSSAAEHNVFLSFGENITQKGSGIPDDGIPWRATRQPIVLQAWPVTPGRPDGKFTTVMSWASYYTREYNSVRYGMKSDSIGHYLDLPDRAGSSFALAVNKASPEAIDVLRRNGWGLVAPREASFDMAAYQAFIQDSKAEFSVAKQGYVVSRSGWFSERSAAYLASGRPVILQDTGFSNWLPTGLGVLSFNNPDEAVAAIDEVNARYEVHCRAARELAREYFDARKILSSLVEAALRPDPRVNDSAPPPRPAG